MSSESASNRREFLTGIGLGREVAQVVKNTGDTILEGLDSGAAHPVAGPTVRLSTRAMACEFHAILNSGPQSSVEAWNAADALDLIHRLEAQMTVYRDHSEILDINRRAADSEVPVEPRLFELLTLARTIAVDTERAYDPTTFPLVKLWRACRQENRVPTPAEVDGTLALTGIEHVCLDDMNKSVRFTRPGIELQLNAIGKGYALDRAGEVMREHQIANWILHGGQSSVLAQGDHHGLGGWPVGVMNPLFPNERLGTIVLRNQAMGTSGNSVQFFRYQGRRYGHILDPRTGQPAEQLVAATVIAASPAEADALSTAFFVMGLEKALAFCQNRPALGAILIPPPRSGRTLEPVLVGISEQDFHFTPSANVIPPASRRPIS